MVQRFHNSESRWCTIREPLTKFCTDEVFCKPKHVSFVCTLNSYLYAWPALFAIPRDPCLCRKKTLLWQKLSGKYIASSKADQRCGDNTFSFSSTSGNTGISTKVTDPQIFRCLNAHNTRDMQNIGNLEHVMIIVWSRCAPNKTLLTLWPGREIPHRVKAVHKLCLPLNRCLMLIGGAGPAPSVKFAIRRRFCSILAVCRCVDTSDEIALGFAWVFNGHIMGEILCRVRMRGGLES